MSEPAQESDWQNLSVEEQLTHKVHPFTFNRFITAQILLNFSSALKL